jgi:hypothetical protein
VIYVTYEDDYGYEVEVEDKLMQAYLAAKTAFDELSEQVQDVVLSQIEAAIKAENAEVRAANPDFVSPEDTIPSGTGAYYEVIDGVPVRTKVGSPFGTPNQSLGTQSDEKA